MRYKYLILGAGISGLSLGEMLSENEYCILEKDSAKGGYCRTVNRNEYTWDYAGHFFHFKTKELENEFVKRIGLDNLVKVEKNTKIYYKDNLIDYPFQKNIHQLPKEDFIDCLYDLFHKEEKIKYTNFLEMLYGKFGNGIVDRFLKPYNEKLYACDLNKLDVEAMGRFFPYADIQDIIDNMKNENSKSYNDFFLYPKSGAFELIKKIQVPDQNIVYNCNIIGIDLKTKKVHTDEGEIEYEYLISTIPFHSLLEYLNIHVNLSWNKVLVLNMGFDKKTEFSDIHWIYVPDKEINFYRIGFYDNIQKREKGSVYIEIGYPSDANIDVEYNFKMALHGMKQMGIITNQKVVDWNYVIMDPAYVHICNHGEMDKIKKHLEKNNIYVTGRYGAWTYNSMEDCILSAHDVLNRIKQV